MQNPVESSPLPDGALLQRYRDMHGAYSDCFTVSIDRAVSGREFIEAFYTTALFKCERVVLFLIGRGTTDAIIRALVAGEADAFAAWTVEERAGNEILLCDFMRLTRSWLMAGPRENGTQLYFGTASVPTSRDSTGKSRPGLWFRLLLPVHVVYAKALLRAAANKVARQAHRS